MFLSDDGKWLVINAKHNYWTWDQLLDGLNYYFYTTIIAIIMVFDRNYNHDTFFCKGHDQLRSAQESILYVGHIYDWRKITWCKMQHWTLESGSENSTGLCFVRGHECAPEEVRTGSVTTQPDHGSIVKWKRAPGKAIIKLSCSTATGASLAFSNQRSCWAHIICKTERGSLWKKNLIKDLVPNRSDMHS